MKTTILSNLAAALALSFAAPAAMADSRLVEREYKPAEVVRIDGRLGVQATIAFADDEMIENVAVGDSATWQITPNKRANVVFVKPLAAKARTNMTVITNRHRYYFDLVASPVGTPLYLLSFTYPEDEKKTREEAALAAVPDPLNEAEQLALGGDTALLPVDPTDLNFEWSRKGDMQLMPARIYDDGNATYITWAVGKPIPAILVRNPEGEEGPVNFAVRSDVIVLNGVPREIILRSGDDAAVLRNRGTPRKPAAPAPESGKSAAPGTALAAADRLQEQ